jgi:hypothetical protein
MRPMSFGTRRFSRNGDTMKIQLGRELTQRYELYAAITNQNLNEAIQSALSDWMDTIGEGTVEVLTGCVIDSQAERLGLPVAERSASMPLLN